MDTFVGVMNRQAFQKVLDHTLSASVCDSVLMFIDIDHLSKINSLYGSLTGDAVIHDLTKRLMSVKSKVAVGRVSGDQFALLLTRDGNLSHDNLPLNPKELTKLCNSVIHAISAPPYVLNDILYHCSMGVYHINAVTTVTSDDAISFAESAMNRAKKSFFHSVCYYDPDQDSTDKGSYGLYSDLWKALSKQQFKVYYQPRMNLITNKVDGAEALIRWNHPEKGLISPDEFIPALEKSGLIIPVGYWVINQVIKDIAQLNTIGFDGRIGINLSFAQFEDSLMVDKVKDIIEKSGINPSQLEFELTESQIMSNEKSVFRFIDEINKLGASFSLDDFGTGYSSFKMLQQLPVNSIKIDKSFIMNLESCNDSKVITDSLIGMAITMGKSVVAEGVETKFQEHYLINKGCNYAQGFLYFRPSTLSDLICQIGNKKNQLRKYA